MATKKTPPRRKPIKKGGAKKRGSAQGGPQAAAASAQSGDAKVIDGTAEETSAKKRSGVSPFAFAQEVRAEVSKVTWTSRNETLISTVMVLIMVAVMSIFFFLVDSGLKLAVCNVLPIECVSGDSL